MPLYWEKCSFKKKETALILFHTLIIPILVFLKDFYYTFIEHKRSVYSRIHLAVIRKKLMKQFADGSKEMQKCAFCNEDAFTFAEKCGRSNLNSNYCFSHTFVYAVRQRSDLSVRSLLRDYESSSCAEPTAFDLVV